jgi:DNA-binding MarR family transcriptional regulator
VNSGAKRERQLLARLTESERKQLSRLLQKLTASLDSEARPES